jgi:DNA primase small subunit
MPFEGGGMRRHLSVPDPVALQGGLAREVPRHAYYSSAYYKDPSHPIMVSKGWLGADVIFDLDADHLQGAEGKSYAEQLDLVKSKFQILVDEFLLRDFGLSEGDLTLAFSGGRGYHAHVHRESFLTLNSAARRELVEYLGGGSVDLDAYLFPTEKRSLKVAAPAPATSNGPETAEEERPRTRARLPRSTLTEIPRLPPADAPGWKGRFTRSLLQMVARWETMTSERAAEDILEMARRSQVTSMRPAEAAMVAHAIVDEGKGQKIRENLVLDVGSKTKGGTKGVPRSFVDLIVAQGRVLLQGETDAPVTTDIHRLIRLPGSLHGGTGFRVTRLTRDGLDAFDPLRDAVLPVPVGTPAVRVRLTTSVDHTVGGAGLRGTEGESLDLPEPQALFLVLRGEGQVVPTG